MNEKLFLLTSHFNAWRYKSRVRLYNNFAQYLQPYIDANLIEFWTVEVAYGDRNFEVTSPDNPKHLQLRSAHSLWTKEISCQLLLQRLPLSAKYINFTDADIVWARPDWPTEIIHLLQHYDVIQNFSQAVDLTDNYEAGKTHTSIIKKWLDNNRVQPNSKYESAHPGYSWSFRRDALDKLGGLFTTAILGSGDRTMATALMGDYRKSIPDGLSAGYIEQMELWQRRADKHIKGNVGYMPGAIFHHFHSPKANRQYSQRWKILQRHQYDPELDLKPDTQGLWQFADRNCQLHYDIDNYFKERRDDQSGP